MTDTDARLRFSECRASLFLAPFFLLLAACAGTAGMAVPDPAVAAQSPSAAATPSRELRYRIVARYPHDTGAFTQGLFWHDGRLYEGTGQPNRSRIRIVDPKTGAVLKETRLQDRRLFGEGIAPLGDRLVSLTWQSGKGFLWSLDSLSARGEFTYRGQGWGIAATPTGLVMSSGDSYLDFIDPASPDTGTLTVTRSLPVMADGKRVNFLNELEWIDGAIFANVWQTNSIVRIDPDSGEVTGVIDVSVLTAEVGGDLRDKTPNGIAWDPVSRHLYVTGKLWPTMFVIAFE